MEFSAQRNDFIRALRMAGNATSSGDVGQIISFVLIESGIDRETNESFLAFTGTDGSSTVYAKIPARVTQHGAIVIAPHRLITPFSTATSNVVNFSVDTAKNQLSYIVGSMRGRMPLIDANPYPRYVPAFRAVFSVKIADLLGALKRSLISVAQRDMGRAVLEGVYLSPKDDSSIVISASDGLRISSETISAVFLNSDPVSGFVMHHRAVSLLISTLSPFADDPSATALVSFSGDQKNARAVFEFNGFAVSVSPIDLPYPNIDLDRFGSAVETRFVFSFYDLSNALSQVQSVSSELGGAIALELRGVDDLSGSFHFDGGLHTLKLLTEGPAIGSFSTDVSARVKGKSVYVVFNVKYLSGCLQYLGRGVPYIQIDYISPKSPLIIRPLVHVPFDEKQPVGSNEPPFGFVYALMAMENKSIAEDLRTPPG